MFVFRRAVSERSGLVTVDATGLKGFYVWDITYSPNTLLSDLREQLGLKLVPAKAPSDVVVIDDVRMGHQTEVEGGVRFL